MPPYTLIIADGKFYRPAGFRTPRKGEYFISNDGKVHQAIVSINSTFKRTVLRPIIFADQAAGAEEDYT